MNGSNIAGGNPERGRVENDYYATPTETTLALPEDILYPALEPACGEGHISKLLTGGDVVSTDLVFRGYGKGGVDFLNENFYEELYFPSKYNTVITNPPFNLFQEFVEKALKVSNKKVIMFGKLQALEGMKRATFLQTTPLKTVYVFKRRQQLLPNGKDFKEITGRKSSNTMAFAWYVWEKGYTGKPQIEWI
jgi:hypothetical protein